MSGVSHPPGDRLPTFLVAAALVLAVVAVYAPTLGAEFLACDDDVNVTSNAVVLQGLTAPGARWALTTTHGANWHPLTWLSHMLDVELFGLDAGGHHATSTALHAAAAVLLFLALSRLTGAFWCAAAVAFLFALHPLRVESVAWVAERKDVLSGLFFSATLLAWAGWCARPTALRYVAVALLFALGLLAKPMLVTLPFVLLLLDVWPQGRRLSVAQRVREKLPLLGIALLGVATALWSQASRGAVASLAALPLAERLANAAVAYVAYLGKMFWPAGLAAFYPHPASFRAAGESPFDLAFFASAALLVGVTAIALQLRRSRPYLAVGWFWYLGMLVPVIGLVHIGQQALADRYTYLPGIGIAIAVVFALGDAARHRPALRRPAVAFLGLALLVCAVASWRQAQHWRTTVTLFEHALAVTDRNYFAHNHLGRHFENAGDLLRAREEYQQALAIYERDSSAHANLANLLLSERQTAAAITHLERSVALDSGVAKTYNSLGLAREQEGRQDLAAAAFERALSLDPELFSAHYNYSRLLLGRREVDAGLRHLERAVQLDPGHAEAANNLGVSLVGVGRSEDAILYHRRVHALEPERADYRCNFGVALEKTGSDEALAVYREALAGGDPCFPAHRALARHLTAAGEDAAALPHYRAMVRQYPKNPVVRRNLAVALIRAGAPERARQQLEVVLQLNPDDATARTLLGELEGDPE